MKHKFTGYIPKAIANKKFGEVFLMPEEKVQQSPAPEDYVCVKVELEVEDEELDEVVLVF